MQPIIKSSKRGNDLSESVPSEVSEGVLHSTGDIGGAYGRGASCFCAPLLGLERPSTFGTARA